MKRKKPLQRKKGLKGSSPPLHLVPLKRGGSTGPYGSLYRKIDPELLNERRIYSEKRIPFFENQDNQICAYPDCIQLATDVHHVKGRGAYLLDTQFWKPLCRQHHDWLENNPAKATEIGLLISSLNKHTMENVSVDPAVSPYKDSHIHFRLFDVMVDEVPYQLCLYRTRLQLIENQYIIVMAFVRSDGLGVDHHPSFIAEVERDTVFFGFNDQQAIDFIREMIQQDRTE